MKPFTFIPGESFNGAVARWADQVGGVERMIDLTRVAGVRYGHRQRVASAEEADIRALAAEMEVDPDELLRRAAPNAPGEWTNHHHPITFLGVTVPSLMVEKRVRRFSPSALATSPHHRAIWDVRLIPACTITGEILLCSCGSPECGPTGWSATLGIDRCEHCMADLTGIEAERIAEADRISLSQVAALFSLDDAKPATALDLLPPAVARLGVADVLYLLTRVAPVVDRRLPTNIIGLLAAPPADLCAAVAAAWRILVGWPDAMAALAAERVRGRTGRHNDGNRGRTMRFLTRKCHPGASDAVLDLIADWRRSLTVDTEEGAALRERTVAGTAVSRITGFDSNRVVEHRRDGLLQVHFALDQHRPESRYDMAEIDAIGRAVADRCTVAGARGALGMSSHGVEQLVAMRLLNDINHPVLDAHYGARQISASSLAALLDAVRASAKSRESVATFPLRSAMKAVGGRVKPWGPVLQMLLLGELPFTMADNDRPLSERVLIDGSAATLLSRVRLPGTVEAILSPSMSKEDAGELLNLNPAKITALLAGSKNKAVPLEAVLRLARRHISTAEMAMRRGLSPAEARSDACAARVPDLGPAGFDRARAELVFFDG